MEKITAEWTGKAVSKNDRVGARAIPIKGKYRNGLPVYRAMIYEKPEYKNFKLSLASAFPTLWLPQRYYDLEVNISLWKVRDSGNCLEPIMDAIEQSGVISNDNLIRHINIRRSYHRRDEPDQIKVFLTKATGKEKV